MILVFGGTTEGRKAVAALEEAGAVFYYSTRSDGQEMELVHGQRLIGAMDVTQITDFCREHAIRLIVDAAHPFAEELHRNLLYVAHHIEAPIIRFDRIYPPHTDDVTWCKDYDDAIQRLETQGIDRLLALTGVQTISRLRPFWQHHECWWRILDRHVSKALAQKNGFPEDHLVYYEKDDTGELIRQLQPQAILTKESGESGGFKEKVEAARLAGISVFAVERPPYPPHTPSQLCLHIEHVNGEHGLRRTVERLLPDFYPLHSGLTTGTCATAAAIAAAIRTTTGQQPPEVAVTLPNGEQLMVNVGYASDYAYVIKDSGDDPDVTNGLEIRAAIAPTAVDHSAIASPLIITAGEGIGRFTLPGFDYPPGEPAINRSPRQMIEQNLKPLLTAHPVCRSTVTANSKGAALSPTTGIVHSWTCTLSVPGGAEIARRTFNPRLGIVGGISIIGVSGIIKPFSEDAFIDSIRKCMQVARASGSERVVINSGAKSERFVKALYPALPQQAFVEYGNFIGATLRIADELQFGKITLGVMLGKAVKLAEGQLDTHSRKGTMNKAFINVMLRETGLSICIDDLTLARELWERLPADQLQAFVSVVIRHCRQHCKPLVPKADLEILLIDDNGNIYSAN